MNAENWAGLRDSVYQRDVGSAFRHAIEIDDEVADHYIESHLVGHVKLYQALKYDDLTSLEEADRLKIAEDIPLLCGILAAVKGHPCTWRDDVMAATRGLYVDPVEQYRAASEAHTSGDEPLFARFDTLSYSDYSGGVMYRANVDGFLESFDELDGVVVVGGHYGSASIFIRLDLLLMHKEIQETILSLDGYPCLDDGEYSEAMMEAEEEAWDGWVGGDFVRELEKTLDIEIEEHEDEPGEDALWELFRDAMESSNTYWDDTNEGVYIDVRPVVARVTLDILRESKVPFVLMSEEEEE